MNGLIDQLKKNVMQNRYNYQFYTGKKSYIGSISSLTKNCIRIRLSSNKHFNQEILIPIDQLEAVKERFI